MPQLMSSKYNEQKITADEALTLLDSVAPKKYTRNDKDDEPRHGFIAQELEAVCTGHFACLVGTGHYGSNIRRHPAHENSGLRSFECHLMAVRPGFKQQVESPRDIEFRCIASKSVTRSSSTLTRRAQHTSAKDSDIEVTIAPIFIVVKEMGNMILNKLFGGGGPVVESSLQTQGACQSQCCDTEIISETSSSSSSDSMRTHASHHVKSRSFETIPTFT